MNIDDFICPACDKPFRTEQGLNSHLTTSRSCSWYRRGKIADLQPWEDDADLIDEEQEPPFRPPQRDIPPDQAIQYFDEDEPFYFFPDEPDEPVAEEGVAGPGPSTTANRNRTDHRVLEDEDDERVEEIHPHAGKVIAMDRALVAKWRLYTGGGNVDTDGDVEMSDMDQSTSNPYAPFASEIDWRVARWAVKDGPGHNALNRLLEIPGVRYLVIFLLIKLLKFS